MEAHQLTITGLWLMAHIDISNHQQRFTSRPYDEYIEQQSLSLRIKGAFAEDCLCVAIVLVICRSCQKVN